MRCSLSVTTECTVSLEYGWLFLMFTKHRNNRQWRNPVGQTYPLQSSEFKLTAVSVPVIMIIHKFFFLSYWHEIDFASALRRGLNRPDSGEKQSVVGFAEGRQDPSPKISFHSQREGAGRAGVEKRVISTAVGEQKATWFWGRKREQNG